MRRGIWPGAAWVCIMVGNQFAMAQPAAGAANDVQMVERQGTVEISPAGSSLWRPAQTNEICHSFDRLRTGPNSRMALRWSGQSVITFGASTELEVLPPSKADDQNGLHLLQGILSFFHRDQPGRIQIITRGAVAGVEGTEFVLAVDDTDRTTLSVVDGKVNFGNEKATLILTNGQQAAAVPGQTPARTAGFIANNILQWCFYYPAVLNPDDVPLSTAEKQNLTDSLSAYRAGDLLAALAAFPTNRAPASAGGKTYFAGLLLAVGQVDACEAQLSTVQSPLADALREVIAAVKFQARGAAIESKLATVLLADSYYEQSRGVREISLQTALQLAQQAATNAPDFGFAWERVAELEFSFGRTDKALAALDRSLTLAPRNAQALALRGFLAAAQNRSREAIQWFDQAIAVDAALGNAWLGRGLARIHEGEAKGGREDLLVAAALEPQRAELRSYLGKAYTAAGDDAHAAKEFTLAKKLDPKDPTPWLYSALQNQLDNQINDGIRDLEKSAQLNDNRSVYRSQLLLDQDQAVRSANLAGLYRDAGLFDLSLREAGRAVSSDYANYSAHLFLANSYDQLRDPNGSNLRYDTPATAEFFIANLLAPTSAGLLSANVSQRPYAQLFDDAHFGAVSDAQYLSRGVFQENADHYYTSDTFSYDVGFNYRNDPGQRPNSDYLNRELDVNLKGQLTSQDTLFGAIQIVYTDMGDNRQAYSQSFPPIDEAFYGPGGLVAAPNAQNAISSTYRFSETQLPNVFLGYHHEWSPGVNTLLLVTHHEASEQGTTEQAAQGLFGFWDGPANLGNGLGEPPGVNFFYQLATSINARISVDEYSGELQHIWETPDHTTIIGARYELGHIRFRNTDTANVPSDAGFFNINDSPIIADEDFTLPFHHATGYGYHNWQMFDSFAVDVGVAYDYLLQPDDNATLPLAPSETPFANTERTTYQLSPKGGFVWTPARDTTVRGAFTRSLSGFAAGQSDRLEPTEVAGFNQAFTSLVPEAIVGDTSGSRFDTMDLLIEKKFDSGTYLSLAGEILHGKVEQLAGDYLSDEYASYLSPINEIISYPAGMRREVDYMERNLTFTVDQLLGRQWTVGGRYRISKADADINYVQVNGANLIPNGSVFQNLQNLDSVLQTINLHANWNHPSGLFSILESNWYHQSNRGYSPAEPGDDFWQFNAYAGWRFWHRRAEVSVGLLNLFDQNYSLEPLNLYNEMARSRTFLARLLITF